MRLRFRGWDEGEYAATVSSIGPRVPSISPSRSVIWAQPMPLMAILKTDINATGVVLAPTAFRRPLPLPATADLERGNSIIHLVAKKMVAKKQREAIAWDHSGGDVRVYVHVSNCYYCLRCRFFSSL